MIKVTKHIEPRPTPRPFVTRSGVSFFPKQYKEYRAIWAKEWEKFDKIPADNWVKIQIHCEYEMPKSLKGRKYPFPKHDVDNLAKAILDSMNKVLFHDDTQVVSLKVTKDYYVDNKVSVKVQYGKD